MQLLTRVKKRPPPGARQKGGSSSTASIPVPPGIQNQNLPSMPHCFPLPSARCHRRNVAHCTSPFSRPALPSPPLRPSTLKYKDLCLLRRALNHGHTRALALSSAAAPGLPGSPISSTTTLTEQQRKARVTKKSISSEVPELQRRTKGG